MNPNAESVYSPNRRFALLGATTAILVGGGALAACNDANGPSINYGEGAAVESTVVADAETLQGVEAACGTALNLEANSANTLFAGPEALLPSLASVDAEGKKSLISATDASSILQKQVATDARVLATLEAVFIETRNERQLPGSQTITRIGDLVSTYETNSQAAADAAIEVCAALDEAFLVPTSDFAVTKGQATEFITVRDENGNITVLKTQTIQNTGSLVGFKVGFNKDANLTDEQVALFAKLEELALVTQDGTIVINQTIGEGSITVEDFEDKTKAQPEVSDSTIPAGSSDTSTPANGTTPAAGTNGGGGNGGGGDAPTEPSTPDAPGNPDTTGTPTDVPGTQPGTTGGPNTTGTTPNTTGTTRPTSTTVVVTSAPPTLPPTTIVVTTTTQPNTTTTQPKGSAPTTTLPGNF